MSTTKAWPSPRWVGCATVLVIAACAVRAVVLLMRAGYVADDLVNLSYARASRMDGTYLARNVFGEFEPGLRLVNWLLARSTPVERWPAVVIGTVALVAVLTLLAQVLHRLAGPTWWMPVMVGLVGWSVIATATVVWWSSSLTYVVGSAFGLLMVREILDFAVLGGWHRPVVAVLSLAACVSLYPGAAVFPLFAAFLWLLFRPDGAGMSGAAMALVRRWRLWALLAAPLVLAAAVAWGGTYGTGAVAGPRALALFVWASWSETIVPSLFGLPPQFLSHRVVGEELLAVLVVASVATYRGTWRAWVAFIVPSVAVLLAHGVARLANLGPGIEFIRSDLLPVELMAAIAVPLAFGRSAGVFTRVGAEPRGWWRQWNHSHVIGVAVAGTVATLAVLAVYEILVTFGTPAITEVQQTGMARAYLTEFTRSWMIVHRKRPDAFVVDSIVPYPISISTVPDVMYPYDTAALDLGMFDPTVHFAVGPGRPGQAYAATFPSGRLLEAHFAPGPLVDLRPVGTSAIVDRMSPDGDVCLSTGPIAGTAWLRVAPPSFGSELALGRRTSWEPFVDVAVDRTSGRSATIVNGGPLRRGWQRLGIATVELGPLLAVDVPARSTTCIQSVSLGFIDAG